VAGGQLDEQLAELAVGVLGQGGKLDESRP
jgi:hypothetical protein